MEIVDHPLPGRDELPKAVAEGVPVEAVLGPHQPLVDGDTLVDGDPLVDGYPLPVAGGRVKGPPPPRRVEVPEAAVEGVAVEAVRVHLRPALAGRRAQKQRGEAVGRGGGGGGRGSAVVAGQVLGWGRHIKTEKEGRRIIKSEGRGGEINVISSPGGGKLHIKKCGFPCISHLLNMYEYEYKRQKKTTAESERGRREGPKN